MKYKKHIKSFNEATENLNISDVRSSDKKDFVRKNIMPLVDFLEEKNMLWEDFHERKFYRSKLYPITLFFFMEGKCWFVTNAHKSATGEVEPETLPKSIKKEFDRYRQTFY